MCITAIAWQLFDNLPLVLLSNRDEFFYRPTTPAHQWPDAPIFAGRDDKSGGTWLGIHQQQDVKPLNRHNTVHHSTINQKAINQKAINQKAINQKTINQHGIRQNGRWAAVLNFREGSDKVQANPEQRSRGELITRFLISDLSPLAFARQIELTAYAGFNLIVGDVQQAVLVNNRGYPPTVLHSGLHILSNGQPDSDWFKCERLRGRVRQEVLPLISESLAFYDADFDYWQAAAWAVLEDCQQAPDEQLPQTGLPPAFEKSLSAICIDTPDLPTYGTRTQSILTLSGTPKQSAQRTSNRPVLRLDSREYLRIL